MRFNANFSSIRNYGPEIADLLMSGIQWLAHMHSQGRQLGFVQWSRLMRSARGPSDKLQVDQLIWLWDVLTTEPRICRHLGERLISIDEMWRGLEPIKVLPSGSRFGIFLKSFGPYGDTVQHLPPDLEPDAEAEIVNSLYMKPGRARRLECRDVPTNLELRPPKLTSREAEAAELKVDMVIRGRTKPSN